MSRLPARGYTWPPFEPGNLAAKTHGMASARIVGPGASEALENILQAVEAEGIEFPLRPTFAIALEALAETVGQVRVGRQHLATAHVDGSCERETCALTLDRFEARLDKRLDALGMTPASRARIEQALSSSTRNQVDAVAALDEARRLRLAAEQGSGATRDGAAS
jgi:hypothetical protein